MAAVLALVLLVGVLIAVLYNGLVRDRNRVSAAWSDIDVQLQRRHDLIPQLVEAVDQYAKYERATIEAVTTLRHEAMKTGGVLALGSRCEIPNRKRSSGKSFDSSGLWRHNA
jgi:LemA protein